MDYPSPDAPSNEFHRQRMFHNVRRMLEDLAYGGLTGDNFLDHFTELYSIATDSSRVRQSLAALDDRLDALVDRLSQPHVVPAYVYELGEDYRHQFPREE